MNLFTLIPQVKELPRKQSFHHSEWQSSTNRWNQRCRNKFATANVFQVSFKISWEYSVSHDKWMKPAPNCLVTEIHKIIGSLCDWWRSTVSGESVCLVNHILSKDHRSHALWRNTTAHLHIFSWFVEQIDDVKLTEGYFQQDTATYQTSREPIPIIQNSSKERVISKNPLPRQWVGLTVPNFFWWGYLKERILRNKPHTNDTETKHKIKSG